MMLPLPGFKSFRRLFSGWGFHLSRRLTKGFSRLTVTWEAFMLLITRYAPLGTSR
jgi:hypothetical protein